MPSGYTKYVIDNEDLSLREFAWICARAMGFCVMQRDDTQKSPVIMDEKPSEYYVKRIEELEQELAEISALSDEEYKTVLAKENTERQKYIREEQKKRLEYAARLKKMKNKVIDWDSPQGLFSMKNFMLEQLNDSIKWDGPSSYFDNWKPATTSRDDKIANLKNELEYARKNLQEEITRVNQRNRYKALLLESIGEPLSEKELEEL